MRITRELLLKLARTTVANRLLTNRSVLCVYLTGSLLDEEPLLGGTADIDLIFIHDSQPPAAREVERISNEVHLDIAHLPLEKFQHTRSLRTDPWFGSFLCASPIVLHDTHHWFDFIQASVCSQFHDPEYVVRRARALVESAREAWLLLSGGGVPEQVARLQAYLSVLEKAANAIACLSGPPLTERRFLLQYPKRAAAVGRPGLSAGLVELFMSQPVDEAAWQRWIEAWGKRYQASATLKKCPPRLHACRWNYYERTVTALRQEYPEAALWILLRTWTLVLLNLADNESNQKGWKEACLTLELDDNNFDRRLEALDVYLDNVEETIDLWGEKYGIERSAG